MIHDRHDGSGARLTDAIARNEIVGEQRPAFPSPTTGASKNLAAAPVAGDAARQWLRSAPGRCLLAHCTRAAARALTVDDFNMATGT